MMYLYILISRGLQNTCEVKRENNINQISLHSHHVLFIFLKYSSLKCLSFIYIYLTHILGLQYGCGMWVITVVSPQGNPGSSTLCCEGRRSCAKTLQILTKVDRRVINSSFCVVFQYFF